MTRLTIGPRRTRSGGVHARWRLPGRDDIARFLTALGPATRSSAFRAVVDGARVTVTLKKRGVRPLLTSIDQSFTQLDPDRSTRVAAAVDAGLGLVPVAPTCLRRSVTLLRELNRLGIGAALHVGVRSAGEVVEAHAWVQSGDVVVNDDPAITATYTELAAGELEKLLPLLD